MENEPYRPLCGAKRVFNDQKPKDEGRKPIQNEPIGSIEGPLWGTVCFQQPKAESRRPKTDPKRTSRIYRGATLGHYVFNNRKPKAESRRPKTDPKRTSRIYRGATLGHYMFSRPKTESRRPKTDPKRTYRIDRGATLGHYMFSTFFNNRKPKAEGRKPIQNEPLGSIEGPLWGTVCFQQPKAESRKPKAENRSKTNL